ncbi:unnamed protein product, partial [Symbiodinium microadriaticum]
QLVCLEGRGQAELEKENGKKSKKEDDKKSKKTRNTKNLSDKKNSDEEVTAAQ